MLKIIDTDRKAREREIVVRCRHSSQIFGGLISGGRRILLK